MRSLFLHNVDVAISGRPRHEGGLRVYSQYVQHLHATRPELSESERFEQPYWDYLQIPLQPLADNLESQTYEVFEKDPVKYVNYEEAVFLALQDLRATLGGDGRIIVMVVGAGRGPLVRASLRASDRCGIPIYVYALDKNPNAVNTLRCRLPLPLLICLAYMSCLYVLLICLAVNTLRCRLPLPSIHRPLSCACLPTFLHAYTCTPLHLSSV
jgi:hypothetical protein